MTTKRTESTILQTIVDEHVKTWQRRLHLDRWYIEVKWEVLSEDGVAETIPEDMYDHATFKFNPDKLLGKSPDYIEKTVIHELLHLHDRDRKMLFAEIEGSLSPEVWRLYDRIIYQQTEGFVDRLASCLYDLAHAEV